MSVLVQFRVRVPDVERFRTALGKWRGAFEEDGARLQQAYVSESDPSEVTMLAEWDSHDAMHASSERRGDAFQADAGTHGLDWETRIWHRVAGAERLRPVEDPSVLVQFRVRVPDVERFGRAFEQFRLAFEEDGGRQGAVYRSESDPSEVTMLAEWDSHDAMMESSERRGDDFQADAGTEGLDWETRIWHRLA